MRRLISVSMLMLCSIMATAQTFSSSPYSIYGAGMLQQHFSGMNSGMSGTGIAVQDAFNLNHINPASYGSITQPVSHVFEMGLYASSNRFSTSQSSESETSGGLTHLNYWFKFKPWWSATFGLTPFSSMSYDVTGVREIGGSDVDYRYSGSGNINALKMGNAFNVGKNLSLGFNASFLFGSLNKFETAGFSAETLTLENNIVTRKLTIDAGVQYRINLGDRALILGAVASPSIKLKGAQSSALYNEETADTLYVASGNNVHYTLPANYGFGMSLQGKRSVIAVDAKYAQWSKADFANDENPLMDTWRLSAGYAYNGNPNATSYFGLIALRAGVYAQNHYLNLKDHNLKMWGWSFGASFPAFDNRSSINLIYGFDQMGTVDSGLVGQQSHTLTLDIVIRDLWGIKRKFD